MSDRWNWDEEEEAPPESSPEKKKTGRPRRRAQLAGASEGHSNWYLLTGLILGLGLGLLFAWVISPVRYIDTAPAALDPTYKDEYRRAIALAYHASGNLDRARERLALLDPGGSVQALAAQAQRMLAENQPPQEARALAVLAADLEQPPDPARSTPSPQPVAELTRSTPQESPASGQPELATATLETVAAIQTPTLPPPTRTPTITQTRPPTFTPRPTATPLLVLEAPFVVKEKREVCDGSIPSGLLRIFVTGADGQPLPGVRILISWQGGEESFYTGLAPEISPGYADFQMNADVTYNLKVGNASEPLDGLISNGTCGWQLEFSQVSR